MDLFDQKLGQKLASEAPLAEKMRPVSLEHFFGQNKVIGPDKLLRQLIEKDEIPSMIFWGPPGSGKTTLASIIAESTNSDFVSFSAVTSGVKELREIIKSAQDSRKFNNRRTILFIDEIHRWNKSQQDALLPHVENGVVTLIGATTENPSFEVNSALLSRGRVFVLEQLTEDDLCSILKRAIGDIKLGLGSYKLNIDDQTLKYLAKLSNGDARTSLNALEFAVKATNKNKRGIISISQEVIKESLQKSHIYDKSGEQHYNIISALHKSLRGSDADASLYWLARMLESGENPLYVARRLVRFASEDIGLANSKALEQAVAGYQAVHFIGMPECNVNLAQVVVYLAKCQKSNDLYTAYKQVQKDVVSTMDEPVPLHLRNAPTDLMKDLNYGLGYKYSPDFDYKEDQEYLPASLKGRKYLKRD
jgi:putative ATPase